MRVLQKQGGYFLILSIGLIINACQKEELKPLKENDVQKPNEQLGLKQVKLEHGMLIFLSEEHFQNVKKKLDLLTEKELNDWEKNLGFKSMYRIYSNIMDAEELLADKYDALTSKEVEELEKSGMIYEYSDLAKLYLKKGFIKVVKYEDMESLQLKCFASYNAKVLNEEGLVQIGTEIWQFNENNIKVMKDADFSKLDFLKAANEDENGIYIINLTLNKTSFKTYTVDHEWSDENSYDRKKIVAANRFIQYYTNTSHTIFHTEFWAHIALYKYSWHKWRARKDGAFIRGFYKWDDGAGVKTSYETHDFSNNSFYTYTYIDSYSSVSGWIHAPRIVSTHLKYDSQQV